MNLISASQLASSGYLIVFDEFVCRVQDRLTGTLIGAGRCRSGVYVLDHLCLPLSSRPQLPLLFVFPRWASPSGITVSVIPMVRAWRLSSIRAS